MSRGTAQALTQARVPAVGDEDRQAPALPSRPAESDGQPSAGAPSTGIGTGTDKRASRVGDAASACGTLRSRTGGGGERGRAGPGAESTGAGAAGDGGRNGELGLAATSKLGLKRAGDDGLQGDFQAA